MPHSKLRALLGQGTWILVADGEKALLMENITDEKDPYFRVIRKEEQENPPSREQGTDKPGRFPDAGPGHRSAVAETDWHQLNKERFADEVAELLYKPAHRNRFPRLVIVAPSSVLGRIREKLHKEVLDKVVAEIEKDLTNVPTWEIETAVREALRERIGPAPA